jgi:hypothetical protein
VPQTPPAGNPRTAGTPQFPPSPAVKSGRAATPAGTTRRASARRRAPTTARIGFLRETTYPHLYGVKLPEGPRPSRTRERFVADYNRVPKRRWSRRLANYRYEEHFAGEQTLYFYGRPEKRAALSLAMVDIDVHKTGTTADARKFAELLRDRWPGLAFEPSTHGNGVHGYLVVQKRGRPTAEPNAALKALERHLDQLLADSGLDIQCVEVKGTAPEFRYDAEGRIEIDTLKFGMLAKLPRTLTAEQLDGLPRFGLDELLALDPPPRPKAPATRRRGPNAGSVSGVLVSDAELADLPWYAELARTITGGENLRTSARQVATPEDFAVVLLLLKALHKNANADGSMPTARIRGLWESLHRAGDVRRQWNANRFKAVRDVLSDLGLLAWRDNKYATGRACKWAPSAELVRLVTLKASSSLPLVSQSGPGPRPRPTQAETGGRAAA